MQKITLLFTLLITMALSTVVIIFFDTEKTSINNAPKELYQVYLAGEKIGVIKSKERLEEYIDLKQEEIKNKYNVDKVFPPKNLSIQKNISYNDKVLKEEEVYEIIKEKNPFTIKGWIFRIKKEDQSIIEINVIDYNIFERAMLKTAQAFVDAEDIEAYKNNTQSEIKDIGKIIENLYIPEGQITEQQIYISTDEKIFIDEAELTRYLLFGTLEEPNKYIVKAGDTIEQIAFDHKLGTDEFMVVNQQFTNVNSLLVPGQEVSVGLIKPLFDTVVEEHIVEDQVIKYDTKTEYDNTLDYGTTQVKQEGVDGIERVIQKMQTTNGVITNVQIDRASSQRIKEPVDKIVVKGTKTSSGTAVYSSDGKWVWPTNVPYVITSRFGYRWGVLHPAIDISGTGYGSPIYAARDGIVITCSYEKTRGHYIIIQHDNNYYSMYLHLSKKLATVGQEVKAGDKIGTMGNSGYTVGVTGTHLHFAIHIGEPHKPGTIALDPLKIYK